MLLSQSFLFLYDLFIGIFESGAWNWHFLPCQIFAFAERPTMQSKMRNSTRTSYDAIEKPPKCATVTGRCTFKKSSTLLQTNYSHLEFNPISLRKNSDHADIYFQIVDTIDQIYLLVPSSCCCLQREYRNFA